MKLPMIVVFNKEDVADKCKVLEWMRDYEKFQVIIYIILAIHKLTLKFIIKLALSE